VMAVRETRDIIRLLRDRGHCVLFTTHYMDEAARLCDRVAIIVRGRIAAVGSPAELMGKTGCDSLEDAFVALAGGAQGLLVSEYANAYGNAYGNAGGGIDSNDRGGDAGGRAR